MKYLSKLIGIGYLVAMMASCANVKELRYMQGSFDTTKLSTYTLPVPVIQKGDLLSITVFSDNPAATAIYNQSSAGGNTSSTTSASIVATASALPSASGSGYLVDEEGNIQFQGIGKLHIEGLTKAGLIDLLNGKLGVFLTNPYYTIRFLNFKITVIGDVARPGIYSIPSERVNILEAIGLAGDLNVTARRDSVRIIREQNGKRSFGMFDLKRPDIFNNPFYQLQQNDIIYVDLTKPKAAANDAVAIRNIGLATGIISTIAIIISILKR